MGSKRKEFSNLTVGLGNKEAQKVCSHSYSLLYTIYGKILREKTSSQENRSTVRKNCFVLSTHLVMRKNNLRNFTIPTEDTLSEKSIQGESNLLKERQPF